MNSNIDHQKILGPYPQSERKKLDDRPCKCIQLIDIDDALGIKHPIATSIDAIICDSFCRTGQTA